MNRIECIEKINKMIPCKELRNCIFMGDELDENEFLTSNSTILLYFSNLLNVAFLFIYGRYKKWKEVDNVCDGSTPNNFVRVFSELDKIYKDSSLSFDIIENLMVDIQLDIVMNGSITSELRLQNKIVKNENFSKYAYIAKKARKTSRINSDVSLNERYDELIELIATFPFLRDLEFKLMDIDNSYLKLESGLILTNKFKKVILNYDTNFIDNEKEFNSNIDSSLMLVCLKGTYYFLERVENYTEYNESSSENVQVLKLIYWQIGSFNQNLNVYVTSSNEEIYTGLTDTLLIKYDTAFEDYFYSLYSFDFEENNDTEEFRIKNFYNINYKYIKNLAFSISDVLKANSKKILCDLYSNKHKFKNSTQGVLLNDGNKEIFYTWSEIISVLMIEEGATNILANLLQRDREIKERLLRNLEFRFGKNLFRKSAVENNIDCAIKNYNNNNSIDKSTYNIQEITHSSQIDQQIAEIEAAKIIVAVSKAVNGNDIKEYQVCFPISIRSKKKLLDEIKSSDLDLEVKYNSVCEIVSETIKTLHCFYEGFFKFSSIKKEFDNESFFRSLNTKEIANFQKSANNAFKHAVIATKKRLDVINTLETKKIINEFKKFCEKVENGKDNSNYQQYLKDYLGKNKIIDLQMLDALLNCFEFMVDEDSLEIMIDDVKKFFTYLKTGKSKFSNTTLGVIFPYVSTCEYTDILRDGNEIYHFSIVSQNGQEKNLRVLSEFSYNLSEKYYFLPNKLSSDERLNIWIEPIIISYNNFKEDGEE